MWFCFSSDFLKFPFTQHIKDKCKKRSSHTKAYILDAIDLISASLNYPVTRKNAESGISWDVLIEDGILRKVENGYSAIEWLKEQNLFTEKKKRREITESDLDLTNKIPIRDNVFLTENELNSLKNRYPDSTLDAAFNYLSEYKIRTNKIYKSDYRALNIWVFDKITQTQVQSSQRQIVNESPSGSDQKLSQEQKEINLQRFKEFMDSI